MLNMFYRPPPPPVLIDPDRIQKPHCSAPESVDLDFRQRVFVELREEGFEDRGGYDAALGVRDDYDARGGGVEEGAFEGVVDRACVRGGVEEGA